MSSALLAAASTASASAPPLPVKRSSRLNVAAKRSSRSILSADVRQHALSVRLAALESDNQVEEADDDEQYRDEEEDEQVLAGVAGAKAKGAKGGKGKAAGGKRRTQQAETDGAGGGRSGKRRQRVALLDLIDQLGMRDEGAAQPNYLTAASSPPSHPSRAFCSVCGYLSCYTCVRCGMRYCSIPCQRTHGDTTCVKLGT